MKKLSAQDKARPFLTRLNRLAVLNDTGHMPYAEYEQAVDELCREAHDSGVIITDDDLRRSLRIAAEGPTHIEAPARRKSVVERIAAATGHIPGRARSWDWCRFRREQHCWYPQDLNLEVSRQVGYAVWIPTDRGYCPHNLWEEQKTCPAPSEPGPLSRDPRALPDATIPWENGGQRQGPQPVNITRRRNALSNEVKRLTKQRQRGILTEDQYQRAVNNAINGH